MSLSRPERFVALAVFRRQEAVRSRRVLRIEQAFGTAGIALIAAGLALLMAGELISLAAVLLSPLSSGSVRCVIGYIELTFAVALLIAGVIRIGQGLRAGRAFRAAAR